MPISNDTFDRGYTYGGNKTNQGTSTGSYLVNDGDYRTTFDRDPARMLKSIPSVSKGGYDPQNYGSGSGSGGNGWDSILGWLESMRHAMIESAKAQRKLSDKLAKDQYTKNRNNINTNEVRASRYLDRTLGRTEDGFGQGQRYWLAGNSNKNRANNDLNLTNNLLQNEATEKSAIAGANANFMSSAMSGLGSMTPASFARFADYIRSM